MLEQRMSYWHMSLLHFELEMSKLLSLPSSVATAITGFPSNISTFYQNISCTGNENVGELCPFLPATDPQCNDISANRTAGVRCTQSELLAGGLNIILSRCVMHLYLLRLTPAISCVGLLVAYMGDYVI